jgi:antirestriction protein ArdC
MRVTALEILINYAKEELRAELAGVFLMAERGIPHNPDSHAAYVGSWLKKSRARDFAEHF